MTEFIYCRFSVHIYLDYMIIFIPLDFPNGLIESDIENGYFYD